MKSLIFALTALISLSAHSQDLSGSNWVNEGESSSSFRSVLGEKFEVSGKDLFEVSEKEFLCSSEFKSAYNFDLTYDLRYENVPQSYWGNPEFLEALGCVNPQDPAIHKTLAEILLEDEDWYVRSASARVLGEVKSQDSRIHKVLVKTLLEDEYGEVRAYSARALGVDSKDPEVHEALVKALLEDSYSKVREYSAWALQDILLHDIFRKINHEQTHKALLKALIEDVDFNVRENIIWIFKKIKPKDPEIPKTLIKALLESVDLSEDRHWVRNDIMRSLRVGQIARAIGAVKPRDPEIHKLLANTLLKEEHEKVREGIAWALRDIQPQNPEVLETLREALKKEENKEVHYRLEEALKKEENKEIHYTLEGLPMWF